MFPSRFSSTIAQSFADYLGWPGVVVLGGIVLCVVAGLLSLLPDPERPKRFIPVYALGMVLFLAGLAAILWSRRIVEFVAEAS